MFACGIYFHTELPVLQQMELFAPLLREWIGANYADCYLPENDFFYYNPDAAGFSLALKRNGGFGKPPHDQDRFRFCLSYIDMDQRYSDAENLARIESALQLLWSHGIPTCTPGWTDELPNAGGETGPVPWP